MMIPHMIDVTSSIMGLAIKARQCIFGKKKDRLCTKRVTQAYAYQ